MNVQRLREVRALILAKPGRFDMDEFAQRTDDACGTTCCIGGHAAFLAGLIRNQRRTERGLIDAYAVTKKGQKVNDSRPWAGEYSWPPMFRVSLGLDVKQSERLFSVSKWPVEFQDAYDSADTAADRAKIAAKRITHFIKTKGRE